jgi:integrase
MPQVTPGDPQQLCLFDLGVDMNKLRRRREELRRETRSAFTLTCYRSDWGLFEQWCSANGREALPVSADTLSLFVTYELEERGLKVATLSRKLNSLRWKHAESGHPFPSTQEARAVMRGCQRERKEQPEGKTAITLPVLRRVVKGIPGDDALSIRDRAVLLLGFCSGLRRGELSRLDLADVSIVPQGLRIHLAWSKTDQGGEGCDLGIQRAARDGDLCPVGALRAWLHVRGPEPGALFKRVTHGGAVTSQRLGAEAIADVVKRGVERIGLDPDDYGAHSMRAGMVTVAASSGASVFSIMKRTRHKSVRMVERYFRPDLFEADPLGLAL